MIFWIRKGHRDGSPNPLSYFTPYIIHEMLRCSTCFFWISQMVNESFSVISFAVKRKCYSLQHKIFPKTFGGIENDSYICNGFLTKLPQIRNINGVNNA